MRIEPLISKRAEELQSSLTLEISALASDLKKRGQDICSLSAGEPDFETPQFIIEATIKALKDGITRYGPAGGDPELKEAIANKLSISNGIEASANEILVTNGGKQAIYNLCQIILNPGDEVIIPSPYWLSYPQIVSLAGGIPITIDSNPENGFKLNIEKLNAKITTKTKLIILNSPNNPTGRVSSKEEMQEITELLRTHKEILILSDEIYEYIISNEVSHYSFGSVAKDISERVFTVNGFAKAWAMTGWRIGYIHGNKEIIKKATALQSQSTSNVCSFAQKGALAAITSPLKEIDGMISSYNERRKLMNKNLANIHSLINIPQNGTFYSFPKLPDQISGSQEFCRLALKEVGLAMVPGIAFGNDRCVRLSCSVSPDTIKDGTKRLNYLIKSYD